MENSKIDNRYWLTYDKKALTEILDAIEPDKLHELERDSVLEDIELYKSLQPTFDQIIEGAAKLANTHRELKHRLLWLRGRSPDMTMSELNELIDLILPPNCIPLSNDVFTRRATELNTRVMLRVECGEKE